MDCAFLVAGFQVLSVDDITDLDEPPSQVCVGVRMCGCVGVCLYTQHTHTHTHTQEFINMKKTEHPIFEDTPVITILRNSRK